MGRSYGTQFNLFGLAALKHGVITLKRSDGTKMKIAVVSPYINVLQLELTDMRKSRRLARYCNAVFQHGEKGKKNLSSVGAADVKK